jgi:colicin import membrane protein
MATSSIEKIAASEVIRREAQRWQSLIAVAADLEKFASLETAVEAASKRLAAAQAELQGVTAALEEAKAKAAEAKRSADADAKATKDKATKEAEEIVSKARSEAAEIIEKAEKQRAALIERETRSEVTRRVDAAMKAGAAA